MNYTHLPTFVKESRWSSYYTPVLLQATSGPEEEGTLLFQIFCCAGSKTMQARALQVPMVCMQYHSVFPHPFGAGVRTYTSSESPISGAFHALKRKGHNIAHRDIHHNNRIFASSQRHVQPSPHTTNLISPHPTTLTHYELIPQRIDTSTN